MTRTGKRALALGLAWAAIMTGVVLVPGCFTRNCEGSLEFYGKKPGEGRLISENQWESNAETERWLDFPRQRTYDFDLRALADREPALVLPYLSGNPTPNQTNDNHVIATGNLAEISGVSKGHVVIRNGTCADYYLRLVVTVAPSAPSLATDAGVATDGSPDAPPDAPKD